MVHNDFIDLHTGQDVRYARYKFNFNPLNYVRVRLCGKICGSVCKSGLVTQTHPYNSLSLFPTVLLNLGPDNAARKPPLESKLLRNLVTHNKVI